MKKFVTFVFILFTVLNISSCKKGYTYLSATSLNTISMKNTLYATGKIIRRGEKVNYSFVPNSYKSTIDLVDGNLYISDAYTNRVLKFGSDKKLELIIYTEKILNTTFYESETQVPNKKIPDSLIKNKYEIIAPGVITADNDGNIYVETFKKSTGNKPPFHYILKFNREGKFQFKIGRDGRDGLHFGNKELITSIRTDSNGNVYVISRYKIAKTNKIKPYGIMIKVFNREGKFIFKVRSHNLLSRVETGDKEFAIVENMFPAPNINSFIFSAAVYNKKTDSDNVKLSHKVLYKINYVSNSVKKVTEFPEKELSLLNVTNSGNIYLNEASGSNLDVVIMNSNGKVLKRNRVKFFTGEGNFLTSKITSSGKILGVFYYDDTLRFYSWL